jgi:uncharacterized protein with NRDE domain
MSDKNGINFTSNGVIPSVYITLNKEEFEKLQQNVSRNNDRYDWNITQNGLQITLYNKFGDHEFQVRVFQEEEKQK